MKVSQYYLTASHQPFLAVTVCTILFILSLVLFLVACLWRRKRKKELDGIDNDIPESSTQQDKGAEGSAQAVRENSTGASRNRVEFQIDERSHEMSDSRGMKTNKSSNKSNYEQKKDRTEKSFNINIFNRIFKSKKEEEVDPTPEYLASRRDTVQHDRTWQRKYSAQWHNFVENELFQMPTQVRTPSQTQLVQN